MNYKISFPPLELRTASIIKIAEQINDQVLQVEDLNGLSNQDKWDVSAHLSVSLPLSTALALLRGNNDYWKRRCFRDFPPLHKIMSKEEKENKENEEETKNKLDNVVGIRGNENWLRVYLETFVSHRLSATIDVKEPGVVLRPCGNYLYSLTLPCPHEPSDTNHKKDLLQNLSPSELLLSLRDIINRLPKLNTIKVSGDWILQKSGKLLPPTSVNELYMVGEAVKGSNLVNLSLYKVGLDDAFMVPLFRGFKEHRTLRSLDFGYNKITCASLPELVKVVQTSKIKSLNLQYNQIGYEGCKMLGEHLGDLSCLKVIILDMNPLKNEGSGAILRKVGERSEQLQLLSLAACRISESKSCWEDIASSVECGKLDHLNLSSNLFNDVLPKWLQEKLEISQTHTYISSLDSSLRLIYAGGIPTNLPDEIKQVDKIIMSTTEKKATDADDSTFSFLNASTQNCHGIHLKRDNFSLEKQLQGMCLSTKMYKPILNSC